MKWSIGRSRYGQVEAVLDTPWQEFVEFCRDIAQLEFDPADKDSHAWFGPFILNDGAKHRTLDDVDHMAALLVLDLDHGNLPLTDIRLRACGLRFVAYTTASSTPCEQKWRLAIQLSRESSVAEHFSVWKFFASKFPAVVDTRVHNANRIFYLPAAWTGDADNVFFASDCGNPADVDSILAMVAHTSEPAHVVPFDHNAILKEAPDGTALITSHMIALTQSAPPGGRLWRMLTQAAKRYRINGWDLTAAELEDAATQANAMFAPNTKRHNLRRECQRAIDWAARNFQPMTPIEKMRNRILWERRAKS